MQTAQETWTIRNRNAEVPHPRVAFALTRVETSYSSAVQMTRKASSDDAMIGELVDQARSGSRQALERLLIAMRPRALAAALKVLRNQDDADDAVQEAFVKIWRCLRKFEGRSSFSTWVHRIVTNASLDLLRRKGNHGEMADSTEEKCEWAASIDCHSERNPETEFGSCELQGLVRAAIAALPAPHRQAVELRDLEDCSYLEIADIAKCPVGTVMSRLHHARHKLAEDLCGSLSDSIELFAA